MHIQEGRQKIIHKNLTQLSHTLQRSAHSIEQFILLKLIAPLFKKEANLICNLPSETSLGT